MSDVKRALSFAEALYRALKWLQLYPADNPKTRAALDAAEDAQQQLFVTDGLSVLEVSSPQGRLHCNGLLLDARTQAVVSLAQLLRERRIQRVVFEPGVDSDDLQLFFFILQLPPKRLAELGGPLSFQGEFSHLVLDEAPVPLVRNVPVTAAEPPTPSPEISTQHLEPFRPEDVLPDLPIPPVPVPPPAPVPVPTVAGPSLADALRLRLAPLALEARRIPARLDGAPWSQEQLEALRKAAFSFGDLSSLAGTGDELNLNQTDPITLRDSLRQALALLPPGGQGAILLGIPTFPNGEQSLRRALDYLAPELLAQAAAEAQVRLKLSKPQLAFIAAALLPCVKDRDLALEALRGRLQFEGWTLEDLDELQESVLWECQGTDTKLRDAIQEKGVMVLDASQVISLVRQALRQGRTEAMSRLLAPVETGLFDSVLSVRRQASQLLANLADCLEDPGLPEGVQSKLLDLLHAHLNSESDTEALQWSAQAMEALLSHSLSRGQFAEAYRIVLALLDLSNAHQGHPNLAWKAQAIQDLVVRLAGPLNMAALVPLLHQRRGELTTTQVHSLLGVMGQPAARYLVVCLGIEEDRSRRAHLIDAIRAIGIPAGSPLREALSAPEWYLVRNAVLLLGEINDKESFEEVATCLNHRDARVRRVVIRTLASLHPGRALPLLAQALTSADAGTRLELVTLFGEMKDPRAVPILAEVLGAKVSSGEDADRLRLRVVEALGLIAAPESIPTLARIFKKRGILQSKESLGVRLGAARALATIGTREAREAMAMAIEEETREEVRIVLRQFLVSGS